LSNIWDTDISFTTGDASALIDAQFPELAPVQASLLGVGWDNAAYLVNGRFVFRFPQRREGMLLMEAETRCLPFLAPHLPLPIPVPIFVGKPEGNYPYPFAGYAALSGTTACRIDWADEERDANAITLARFLSELHNTPINDDSVTLIPRDHHLRADCGRWVKKTEERLRKCASELSEFDLESLISAAYECAEAPLYEGSLRWLHGDLYPRHLLVDSERKICGVIDWGDVHIGDPAMDCSIAYTFLSPVGRSLFRDAYGAKDDAFWRRARYRAFHYGAALTEYGLAVGDNAMVTMAKYVLRNAICPDRIP